MSAEFDSPKFLAAYNVMLKTLTKEEKNFFTDYKLPKSPTTASEKTQKEYLSKIRTLLNRTKNQRPEFTNALLDVINSQSKEFIYRMKTESPEAEKREWSKELPSTTVQSPARSESKEGESPPPRTPPPKKAVPIPEPEEAPPPPPAAPPAVPAPPPVVPKVAALTTRKGVEDQLLESQEAEKYRGKRVRKPKDAEKLEQPKEDYGKPNLHQKDIAENLATQEAKKNEVVRSSDHWKIDKLKTVLEKPSSKLDYYFSQQKLNF